MPPAMPLTWPKAPDGARDSASMAVGMVSGSKASMVSGCKALPYGHVPETKASMVAGCKACMAVGMVP